MNSLHAGYFFVDFIKKIFREITSVVWPGMGLNCLQHCRQLLLSLVGKELARALFYKGFWFSQVLGDGPACWGENN